LEAALGSTHRNGFCLVIIGGGAPYWITDSNSDAHAGPFTYCPDNQISDCTRIDPRDANDNTRTVQAFDLFAIIFSLIGAIIGIWHGCRGRDMKRNGAIVELLTGVCGLIATAVYVKYLTPNENCQSVGGVAVCGWAFGVFVTGWIVSLFTAVIMLLTHGEDASG